MERKWLKPSSQVLFWSNQCAKRANCGSCANVCFAIW